MKRTLFAPVALALALLASGCGAGFSLDLPPRFIELDEDAQEARGYALRGATADGVVVSVRELDNDPKGDLAFYEEAITLELRDRRGYALLDADELRAASGEAGRLLRFGHDEEGDSYVYWLGLFVTEDAVFIVEAGGAESVFAPREAEVLASFRGLRID